MKSMTLHLFRLAFIYWIIPGWAFVTTILLLIERFLRNVESFTSVLHHIQKRSQVKRQPWPSMPLLLPFSLKWWWFHEITLNMSLDIPAIRGNTEKRKGGFLQKSWIISSFTNAYKIRDLCNINLLDCQIRPWACIFPLLFLCSHFVCHHRFQTTSLLMNITESRFEEIFPCLCGVPPGS